MSGLVYLRHPTLQTLGAIAMGVVLAAVGPYGTFTDLKFGPRLGYWITIVALNWLQIIAVSEILVRSRLAGRIPIALRAALAAGLASIPATFEVAWLEHYFRDMRIANLAALYGQVLILTVAVTVPLTLLLHHREGQPMPGKAESSPMLPGAGGIAAVETAAAEALPATARFMRRIPGHLGSTLLALEMEDHYLRVHTDRGSDLILCRFGDALAELSGADGLQVHRSWWVARAALVGSRRLDGGRVVLMLSNDLEAPVSRSFMANVREAGWLEN